MIDEFLIAVFKTVQFVAELSAETYQRVRSGDNKPDN